MIRRAIVAAVVVIAAACGDDDALPLDDSAAGVAPSETTAADETSSTTGGEASDGLYPDVIDAVATRADDGSWSFDVTLSSPYDTPARYADAWRVSSLEGDELGVRELLHDHQNEQPFTRSLGGVEIPDGVDVVIIEGRDQVNGWGGATFELSLP